MPKKNDDVSSLSHTKWNCQYHIVFCPKYRRKAIYATLRKDIGSYLRRLCEYKGVEIVEAHAMCDHIHMLVKIPPKIAVSSFIYADDTTNAPAPEAEKVHVKLYDGSMHNNH